MASGGLFLIEAHVADGCALELTPFLDDARSRRLRIRARIPTTGKVEASYTIGWSERENVIDWIGHLFERLERACDGR